MGPKESLAGQAQAPELSLMTSTVMDALQDLRSKRVRDEKLKSLFPGHLVFRHWIEDAITSSQFLPVLKLSDHHERLLGFLSP